MAETLGNFSNSQKPIFFDNLDFTQWIDQSSAKNIQLASAEYPTTGILHTLREIVKENNHQDAFEKFRLTTTLSSKKLSETSPAKNKIAPEDSFHAEESWTGKITHIEFKNRIFIAELQSDGNPDEIGEFSLEDISEDDIPLVMPGAVFYWSIGKATNSSGRTSNVSTIRFRRLQHWTRNTLEKAKKQAEEFNDWL